MIAICKRFFIRTMKVLGPAAFFLLCGIIEELECKKITVWTDPADALNRTDDYGRPCDFRCHTLALEYEFDFVENYLLIGYALKISGREQPNRCTNFALHYYPILTGSDPMMPYYINTLYEGMILAAETDTFFVGSQSPVMRNKEYCASMRLVSAAFLEYWEKFHSDSNLCKKMVDFIKFCHVFRQMREMFTATLYDKLCLDEEGCYNAMTYYDSDLPYCVKHTAINEFKNSSVGSWHNSVINYCRLTAMVPGIKEAKYDMSILRESGKTKEKLRDMCLYLRYRLLPEEGKEQELPDTSDYEYETFDDQTTPEPEYKSAGSIFVTSLHWIVFFAYGI